jgi:hypothetical protein
VEGSDFDEDQFFGAITRSGTPLRPPSPETLAQISELTERRLSRDEVEAALRIPLGDEERREILSLIDWFCRRYPTPAERLAYVRRAYRRWTKRAVDHPLD